MKKILIVSIVEPFFLGNRQSIAAKNAWTKPTVKRRDEKNGE